MITKTDSLNQLKQLKLAQPFEPFVMVLRDGRKIIVTNRLQFGTDGVQMTVLNEMDHSTRFKLDDVTVIRTIESLLH